MLICPRCVAIVMRRSGGARASLYVWRTVGIEHLGMSALGQKQTFAMQKVMSALPPKADISPYKHFNWFHCIFYYCIPLHSKCELSLGCRYFSAKNSHSQ